MHIYAAYLEATDLIQNDRLSRRGAGSHNFAVSKRPPQPRQASAIFRLIAFLKTYAARQRLAKHLHALDDRLLADAGFTREDIQAVVDGTYLRRPESARVELSTTDRASVQATAAQATANDNEAQVAA